jgi:hypothetical protein
LMWLCAGLRRGGIGRVHRLFFAGAAISLPHAHIRETGLSYSGDGESAILQMNGIPP